MGYPQEERKVEVEEERKIIPTWKISVLRQDLNPQPVMKMLKVIIVVVFAINLDDNHIFDYTCPTS